MNEVSVYLGRQRGEGSPIKRTSLRPFHVIPVPSAEVSNVCEAKNLLLLVLNEEHVHKILEILAIFDYVMAREAFPAFITSRDLRTRLIT